MIKKYIFSVIFLVSSLFGVDAELDIVKKSITLPKIEIAISKDSMKKSLTKKVKNMIEKDLEVSGHFEVLDSVDDVDFNSVPDYLRLSNKGTDLYLNIDSKVSDFGGYSIQIKLYDINSKQLVFHRSFTTSNEARYPFLAHRVSISVNNHLKAPSIDWMDKFILFAKYKTAKNADIVIADYTLTFQKTIVSGGLNIFPKWTHPNKQESFYYTTYISGTPTLKKANLFSNKHEIIMKSEGMIVASDVSNDGSKILITASPNYQPDIYLYDVRDRSKTRLTEYKGIDVGAKFVENDSKFVFVSDRLGYPNIFAKKIGNRGIERLVYHGKNNSSATTHDDFIVYTSRDKKNEFDEFAFNLYLMSTKSDFLKRLTSTGSNQFPDFSPDGESVIFLKNMNGRSSIGIIRLNHSKSFLFPLESGKIQSIDW